MRFRNKRDVRNHIWRVMEERNMTKFPSRGRIPNFRGSERACERLREIEAFWKAEMVFSAPDSVLRKGREICLEEGKSLLVAKPHMKGFLLLRDADPQKASTITGMLRYGAEVRPPSIGKKVNMFLQGCVAVDLKGNRIGKGTGYGDREYTILEKAGAMAENCPVVVIAHDIQIFDDLEYLMDDRDVPADIILTPTRVIDVRR